MSRPRQVQFGTVDRCQIAETRTGPNTDHMTEISADLVARIPTKHERGEHREQAPNGKEKRSQVHNGPANLAYPERIPCLHQRLKSY